MDRRLTVALLALVALSACGSDRRRGPATGMDGGAEDGGTTTDAAATDALPTDAPVADASTGTGRITGTVTMVNAPGGSTTSVVAVPDEGFLPNVPRETLPAGPRADGVDGDFVIEGVPAGRYRILVAWELDGLVLDPDRFRDPTVEVEADGTADAGTFFVTSALTVVSPGATGAETVTTIDVELRWEDEASEDYYALRVVRGDGTVVWTSPSVPSAAGGQVVEIVPGSALAPGELHRFRVTSFREGIEPLPLSTTEPLAGLFRYEP